MRLKLVEVEEREDSVPACLTQRAESKEEFRKSYHTVHHITDVIKEEVLQRVNSRLIPKETDFLEPEWAIRHAKEIGYIKAMRDLLELLP